MFGHNGIVKVERNSYSSASRKQNLHPVDEYVRLEERAKRTKNINKKIITSR